MSGSTAGQTSLVVVLAFAVLTGGCLISDEEPRLDFRLTHFEHLSSGAPPLHLPDSIAADAGKGGIRITGTIRLPDHCDGLRAGLVDRRPALDLRLRVTPSEGHSGPCDDSDRSVLVSYAADIRLLPAGRYHLRVLEEAHVEHGWRFWRRGSGAAGTLLHEEDVLVR